MKVFVVHCVEHDRWNWDEVDSKILYVASTYEKAYAFYIANNHRGEISERELDKPL